MTRLSPLAACALLLALGALSAPPLAAQDDPEAAAADETPSRDEPARRGGWWNEARVVEALSLSEEQRREMDAHFERFREAAAPPGPETRDAFLQALGEADWSGARKALDEIASLAARPVRAHGELKIEVLSLLSDAQRATLRERFPRLIESPWVRPRRPGARGR